MLKKLGIAIVIIAGCVALFLWILDKPKPEGVQGPEAEELAQKMYKRMNGHAWDSTNAIQWSYKGIHSFLWDKKRDFVRVSWENKEVLLNTKTLDGKVFIDGDPYKDPEGLRKAWEFFANDSFWLAAHYKIFDPGTSRAVVETDEGRALLIYYSSGGVTPGDSYLWYLDETGKPYKWGMWVQMFPIGGLEFTWNDWKEMENGVFLPTKHEGPATLEISDLAIAENPADLNNGTDPFIHLGSN